MSRGTLNRYHTRILLEKSYDSTFQSDVVYHRQYSEPGVGEMIRSPLGVQGSSYLLLHRLLLVSVSKRVQYNDTLGSGSFLRSEEVITSNLECRVPGQKERVQTSERDVLGGPYWVIHYPLSLDVSTITMTQEIKGVYLRQGPPPPPLLLYCTRQSNKYNIK